MGRPHRHADCAVTPSERGPSPQHADRRRSGARGDVAVKAGAHDGKLECVITELEMTLAPELPPLRAPPERLALLRAENPTVSFYRYLYDAVGREWLWTDRKRLSDKRLAAIIGDDHVEIYVLYVRGVPAGFGELDLRAHPDIDLAYLGLVPEYIGRGLGSYLLNWIVRRAWERAPSRFRVYTNTFDHQRALSLYQRMGFVACNRRIVYIDPDPDPPHP
jgi:GNAT superfamily N-acetyltransferase